MRRRKKKPLKETVPQEYNQMFFIGKIKCRRSTELLAMNCVPNRTSHSCHVTIWCHIPGIKRRSKPKSSQSSITCRYCWIAVFLLFCSLNCLFFIEVDFLKFHLDTVTFLIQKRLIFNFMKGCFGIKKSTCSS